MTAVFCSSLPCLQQAFETKASTWKKYVHNPQFSTFYHRTFKDETSFISRQDVFREAAADIKTGILSTILWGYPRKMRGISFDRVLNSLPKIAEALITDNQLDKSTFKDLLKAVNKTGIGLSTLTKLLYFFRFQLDSKPCLILDRRILEVIASGRFAELQPLMTISSFNAYALYSEYLNLLAHLSAKHSYRPDQLECFLFLLGRNLKKSTIEESIEAVGPYR